MAPKSCNASNGIKVQGAQKLPELVRTKQARFKAIGMLNKKVFKRSYTSFCQLR
ncbi:hypothetical protein SynNOUM97013_02792 [Synechococcus sp. NOUM97013]|nr:hypothetical protein SynNOUM97013_02792 [Synechococcus sp. NOUM97013]